MGRMDKVNQQLKREISTIIQQELGDPRFSFVSITYVETTKDLRNARVYFSVLGGQGDVEHATGSFDKVRGMIRKLVGQRIKMRHTPELVFIYDSSIESSIRIDNTLKEINDES